MFRKQPKLTCYVFLSFCLSAAIYAGSDWVEVVTQSDYNNYQRILDISSQNDDWAQIFGLVFENNRNCLIELPVALSYPFTKACVRQNLISHGLGCIKIVSFRHSNQIPHSPFKRNCFPEIKNSEHGKNHACS